MKSHGLRRAHSLAALMAHTPDWVGTTDESGIIGLWIGVAEQALADVRCPDRHWRAEGLRSSALTWFLDPCSTWWLLCDRLGWDAGQMAAHILAEHAPKGKRTVIIPEAETPLGKARAWVAEQRGRWHRGEMRQALGLRRAKVDGIMHALQREGRIVETGVRGWWVTRR